MPTEWGNMHVLSETLVASQYNLILKMKFIIGKNEIGANNKEK